MSYIIYPQTDNKLAVIIPTDSSMSIEEIAAKDVPKGSTHKIVDSLDIEDSYFDAYEFSEETGAVVNIDKAKALHLNKFREARKPKLAALDVAFMRAVEQADAEKQSEIATAKQELRDVTKTLLPETLEEIKAVWPAILN
jgi:hypothetical protein